MPPPPVVASVPGAHFAPSHFITLPVLGGDVVVSTSDKKSMLNGLTLISMSLVSVEFCVVIFVPPIISTVLVGVVAFNVPSSVPILENKFGLDAEPV